MKTSAEHTNSSILQRAAMIAAASLLAFMPEPAQAGRPLGVDVSSYQGSSINWSSVLSSGRSFAWAKATGGTGIIDGDFTRNENNGKNAGVYMGAYHFAYPYLNTPGGEAAYFWKEAGGYIKADGKSLQPMLDMEEFKGLDGAGSYTAWANDWCADIVADCNAKGVTVTPMIYVSACNAGYFGSSITGLPWIADYNSENSQTGTPWSVCSGDDVWGTWNVWQFSSSGSVSGIPGSVDQDVFNGTAAQLKASLVIGKTWVYGDYDGDGRADPTMWDPTTGYWYVAGSKGTSWSTHYGTVGDIPVPADYDGDGITDLAVFRISNGYGYWYIHGSKGVDWSVQFGLAGDIPVPGDYDGDGKADIAIFRGNTGTWWIDGSSRGVFTKVWGTNTDICVPADYDGDGLTDPAVWRPSTGYWYVMGSMGTSWDFQWGTPGDIPVPGDYDGDGQADYAIYRRSNNSWQFNCTTRGIFNETYGIATDIQQPADYVGSGIPDIAIWRLSDQYRYIDGAFVGSSNWAVNWGQTWMQPANLPAAIYDVFFLPVTITKQPLNQTVNQGQNATFSISLGGSPPFGYQWKFNAANISGATASSYTVTSAQSTNAGSYIVVVTNVINALTSSVATLTVNSSSVPPSITTQPVSLIVNQ